MTDTPTLPAQRLRHLIDSEGAVSIATYVAIANAHYYATRDPLGRDGDFITAPEISQMFGELIGLWLADLWLRAGSPRAALVELGPGRGTLMADIRRSIARVPGLANAPVHLVETSPTLRAEQAQRVPDAQWHDSIATLPDDCALLIVANEFFDALPIQQYMCTESGWRERLVTFENGRFTPTVGRTDAQAAIHPALIHSPIGSIVETSPVSTAIASDIAGRIATQGGAALIIDYGYEGPAIGDTLQAVKGHRYADVFDMVGEADLTAHVDFAALRTAAHQAHALGFGSIEQGALLHALGIGARAEALKRANPTQAASIVADMQRLTAPEAMGRLFRAMPITAPAWPLPAGFQQSPPAKSGSSS